MFKARSRLQQAMHDPHEAWEMARDTADEARESLSGTSTAAIIAGAAIGIFAIYAIRHFGPDLIRYLKIERM
jgi:hypothetical protein